MNRFDIETVKKRTLIKYPFFGSVIAGTEVIESTKVKTAGTDGKKMIYNPDYMSSLSPEEQVFVCAHEYCHIALNHIRRKEGKDKEVWNIATDAVINAFLSRDGLKMPPMVIDMPEALNHDAEEMYDILMKEKENNKNKNNDNEQDGSGQGSNDEDCSMPENNEGHDDHDFWDDDVDIDDFKEEQDKTNKNEEKKESLLDKLGKLFNKNKKNSESEEERKKTDEIEKISEMQEKKFFEENRKLKEQNLKKLMDEISKEAQKADTTIGNSEVNLGEIGTAKKLIDWRLILREAVNRDVDWTYKDAEIEDGVLKPYLEDIPIPEAEIVLDTSGSIDQELLRCFLRECKNILKDCRIKAGCFDEKFYGFNEIRTEEDIDNMKFIGRGGTNFDAAVNAFSKRVENKIIFTDGKSSMPSKAVSAIWVVFGDVKINPPGGRVIYIDEQRLRNTYSLIQNSPKTR